MARLLGGASSKEITALRVFSIVASLHRCDEIGQPGEQGWGQKLLIGSAQDDFTQGRPRTACVQTDIIAGIVVKEGNPGRVPVIRRVAGGRYCYPLLHS